MRLYAFLNATEQGFNWYGFLIALAIVLCIVGAYFSAMHRGMEGDVIIDMIVICLPLAIIGARTYHVIFDSQKWTFAEFCGFSGGEFKGLAGLAIYGGLIGAIIGAVIFHFIKNRKKVPVNKRVSFFQIVDVGFMFIILGQSIGRWGNIANGEGYGGVITESTWQWSPFGMNIGGVWHYSMPLYESVLDLIGFGILLYLYIGRHKSFDGFVFSCYCIYYGMCRVFLESIRENDVLKLGDVRVSVLVSVLFMLGGIAIIAIHIIAAKKSGKKIFIFVDRSNLDSSYFGYESTKLAHPMPDIEFFKGKRKKSEKDNIIVDHNGVAIRVDDDDDENISDSANVAQNKATVAKRTKVIAEDVYEDKWDD